MPNAAHPLLSLLTCIALAGSAAAQEPDCGEPSNDGLMDAHVIPRPGATGVATNAVIKVRYLQEVDLDALEARLPEGESLVSLFETVEGETTTEFVPGTLHRVDSRTLLYIPDRILRSNTLYRPLIARPGLDGASLDELRFETGSREDREPPEFYLGGDSLQLFSEPLDESCGEPEGSRLVALSVPPAADDRDELSLEYFLYVTRAAGLSAPELRAREPHNGGDVEMAFILSPEEAGEPLCIAVRVVDGVGRVTESPEEICFEPEQGSYFESLCSVGALVARRHPRGRGDFLVISAAMLAMWTRRRRS